MSRRLGECSGKHAEHFIKSAILNWARERQSFDGLRRNSSEIQEIVDEQMASLDDRTACAWVGCDK
jgi:hypothetical protein